MNLMRKIASFLTIFVLSLSLFGCSCDKDDNSEKTEVRVTKDNYEDYFTVKVSMGDVLDKDGYKKEEYDEGYQAEIILTFEAKEGVEVTSNIYADVTLNIRGDYFRTCYPGEDKCNLYKVEELNVEKNFADITFDSKLYKHKFLVVKERLRFVWEVTRKINSIDGYVKA